MEELGRIHNMYGMVSKQAARAYFEDTLGRQCTRLRKCGVDTVTYIDTHRQLLGLVLPPKALDEVMAARGDWHECMEAVATLMSSGPLGKSIFHFAGAHALAADFRDDIEKTLTILRSKPITMDSIHEAKCLMASSVGMFKAIRLLSRLHIIAWPLTFHYMDFSPISTWPRAYHYMIIAYRSPGIP
jgi:hypothetical protein